MNTQDAIAQLRNMKPVNFGPYYTPAEMKRIVADIQAEISSAFVSRSPSTNNWIVYPK